jgi:hypothetical protein
LEFSTSVGFIHKEYEPLDSKHVEDTKN